MGKAVRLGRAMGKGCWGEQWKGAVREGRGRTMEGQWEGQWKEESQNKTSAWKSQN